MKRKKLIFLGLISVLILLIVTGCAAANPGETESTETTAEVTTTNSETETSSETKAQPTTVAPQTKATETKEPETKAPETVAPTTKAPEYQEPSVVIVLDAGHDTVYHSRNHPSLGFNEQDLNLKIAKACKKRLNEYAGVKVYMTRKDGSCPAGNIDGDECIKARTSLGTRKNADLFVSFHCNASTGVLGASANGAEVHISNYKAYTESSRRLGYIILNHLASAVDLNTRDVYIQTDPTKGYYDDGSVQDKFYLISQSVEGGHPGIIIEHAFMDNSHDNALLKNDSNLKKMGIAAADALAEYYNLTLR